MESADLVANAARQSLESLSDPSSVSRPPFQSFANASSAQWYFAKLVVDMLTPKLFQMAVNDNNAWLAQAKLSAHLIGPAYSARFNADSIEYRAVQQLVAETVRELADEGAESTLRVAFGDSLGVDSVDSPKCQCTNWSRIISQASAKNRGRRNEDRLLVAAFLNDPANGEVDDDDRGEASQSDVESSFLAVLDGHGGSDGADLAASYLLPLFLNAKLSNGDEDDGEVDTNGDSTARRLRRAFLTADAKLVEAASLCGTSGGCTCTVCVISGSRLTVAWAGDSEAWLIHRSGQAAQLTNPPHRPSVPAEKARVEAAGGFVMDGSQPRLNGVLAVTRSLGDRSVIGASPEPQIVQRQLDSDSDLCVVLASDGLWDAVSPNDAAAALLSMSADREKQSEAASALIDLAVSSGSTDNVTVIVAWL